MDQQNLRSLFEQLHHEIAANPPTDDRSRDLLIELQQDIEHALTPAADAGIASAPISVPQNLRERVQEAMAGFEGSHPQSAGALERVMTLLSNFGL